MSFFDEGRKFEVRYEGSDRVMSMGTHKGLVWINTWDGRVFGLTPRTYIQEIEWYWELSDAEKMLVDRALGPIFENSMEERADLDWRRFTPDSDWINTSHGLRAIKTTLQGRGGSAFVRELLRVERAAEVYEVGF